MEKDVFDERCSDSKNVFWYVKMVPVYQRELEQKKGEKPTVHELLQGDVLEVLPGLPSESVHMAVTSPHIGVCATITSLLQFGMERITVLITGMI